MDWQISVYFERADLAAHSHYPPIFSLSQRSQLALKCIKQPALRALNKLARRVRHAKTVRPGKNAGTH